MVWKVHACLCVCVCVCVCVPEDGEQQGAVLCMCEWTRNSLTHTFQSACRTPGPLCQFVLIKTRSVQLMRHSECAPTHTRKHTQTHTDTHTHSCHTRRCRWWACGRQIHLRSVPAQRVIRELPNQAKAHWSRPVLRPDSAAVPGWFFFFSTGND